MAAAVVNRTSRSRRGGSCSRSQSQVLRERQAEQAFVAPSHGVRGVAACDAAAQVGDQQHQRRQRDDQLEPQRPVGIGDTIPSSEPATMSSSVDAAMSRIARRLFSTSARRRVRSPGRAAPPR